MLAQPAIASPLSPRGNGILSARRVSLAPLWRRGQGEPLCRLGSGSGSSHVKVGQAENFRCRDYLVFAARRLCGERAACAAATMQGRRIDCVSCGGGGWSLCVGRRGLDMCCNAAFCSPRVTTAMIAYPQHAAIAKHSSPGPVSCTCSHRSKGCHSRNQSLASGNMCLVLMIIFATSYAGVSTMQVGDLHR